MEVKDVPISEIKSFFYDMRIETRNGDPDLMEPKKFGRTRARRRPQKSYR